MPKRPSFDSFKRQMLKNPLVKVEYDRLKPEFDFIRQLIQARNKSKITQAELAKVLKTKQPAIARLENGGYRKASIENVQRYANALGYDLRLKLVKKTVGPKPE